MIFNKRFTCFGTTYILDLDKNKRRIKKKLIKNGSFFQSFSFLKEQVPIDMHTLPI